jgi:acyl carrier protein
MGAANRECNVDHSFFGAMQQVSDTAIIPGNMDSITKRVMEVLYGIGAEGRSLESFPATERLADIGFTSVDMVKVMLGVEAEFDLEIPQQEITPENFISAATIAAMLQRITETPRPNG